MDYYNDCCAIAVHSLLTGRDHRSVNAEVCRVICLPDFDKPENFSICYVALKSVASERSEIKAFAITLRHAPDHSAISVVGIEMENDPPAKYYCPPYILEVLAIPDTYAAMEWRRKSASHEWKYEIRWADEIMNTRWVSVTLAYKTWRTEVLRERGITKKAWQWVYEDILKQYSMSDIALY